MEMWCREHPPEGQWAVTNHRDMHGNMTSYPLLASQIIHTRIYTHTQLKTVAPFTIAQLSEVFVHLHASLLHSYIHTVHELTPSPTLTPYHTHTLAFSITRAPPSEHTQDLYPTISEQYITQTFMISILIIFTFHGPKLHFSTIDPCWKSLLTSQASSNQVQSHWCIFMSIYPHTPYLGRNTHRAQLLVCIPAYLN